MHCQFASPDAMQNFVGFGGEWATGAVLMGEVIRDKYRGRGVGFVQTGAAFGPALAALVYAGLYWLRNALQFASPDAMQNFGAVIRRSRFALPESKTRRPPASFEQTQTGIPRRSNATSLGFGCARDGVREATGMEGDDFKEFICTASSPHRKSPLKVS
jgi:hypothetical protein